MSKLLLFALLACLSLRIEAACSGSSPTRTAASCSNTEIGLCVTAAADGDTINVPAGTCTWSGSVTMPNTKGLKLVGAGAGITNITNGSSSQLLLQTSSARQPIVITGFTFTTSTTSPLMVITGTAQNWRIHHNTFDNGSVNGGYHIVIGNQATGTDSYTFGLMDHNTFRGNFTTHVFAEWDRGALDPVADGDWIWAQPAQRGTAQAIYIEDNTFIAGAQASQTVDCRWGCKYVVRYNAIQNPWIATHSGCTNQGRDPMWVEIYKNTFTDNANRYGGNQIEMRSVSGVVWNNDFAVTANQYNAGVDHERSYRTDCGGPYGGRCDGTRAFDQNAGLHGYICLGNSGWGPPQVSSPSGTTFAGMFFFDNDNAGANVNMGVANNNPYTSEHIVAGRELFNEANMSSGLLAARPATCSAGPAGRGVYWATDVGEWDAKHSGPDGQLYVCTATNVWSLHWKPYAYPHPLAVAAGPAPPTNIHATIVGMLRLVWSFILSTAEASILM